MLHEIFTSRVEKIAFIKGDKDTPFKYIADVVDRMHQAGVDHIGLLTPELQQRAGLREEAGAMH